MIKNFSLISSLVAAAMCSTALPLTAPGAEGSQAARDLELIARHFKENNRDVKPDFNGPGRPFVWVFYGDSITHGAVHTHGWRSFVEIFQERVRTDMDIYYDSFINSGDSGQDSGHLLRDWQYECQVRRHRPTVVSLMIGMNDADGRRTPEEFRANLRRLVKLIRADGAIVVLQTQNTIELYQTPDDSAPDRYWQRVINRYHNYPAFAQVIR